MTIGLGGRRATEHGIKIIGKNGKWRLRRRQRWSQITKILNIQDNHRELSNSNRVLHFIIFFLCALHPGSFSFFFFLFTFVLCLSNIFCDANLMFRIKVVTFDYKFAKITFSIQNIAFYSNCCSLACYICNTRSKKGQKKKGEKW